MTLESWLEAHAYLRPVADLATKVERAAAAIDVPLARVPDFEDYRPDFLAGVSLLSSEGAAVDMAPGDRMARALVDQLAADSRDVPGLSHFVSWTVLARYLRPVVRAFDGWRDEEKWLRRYCPTCGSAPAMAQLFGVDPGRMRLLVCGCCGTRWRFKRTACPFCEADSQQLASLSIEGEPGLRIDHCKSCGGYLKTYDGQGDEALWLSDWSTLHLDLIAHDRGLKRMAASLYEFEP